MKMFFEEYGMVIVVMILAFGMISFSAEFSTELEAGITQQWETLTSISFTPGA